MQQQQIHRMKMFFSMSLGELEKETTETKSILNNVGASRSAFSAALTNNKHINCFGHFTSDKLITYQHVFINLANGYSADTGVFTVPHSGVYSLALTVYSDAGAPGRKIAACANLLVNNQLVAGPREENKPDREDSVTTVVALHLKAGDMVAVQLPGGCFICDASSQYNTFSGFLLYPTE